MKPSPGYALFRTAIGTCGVAWSERGLVEVALPERDVTEVEGKLSTRCGTNRPAKPTGFAAEAVRAISNHLAGKDADLAAVRLDLAALPDFHRKVYGALRKIPRGHTVSYGELAALSGHPGAARAVGQAMARNRFPILVPCHRVTAAGKGVGAHFSAYGGLETQRRLLALEGETKVRPRVRATTSASAAASASACAPEAARGRASARTSVPASEGLTGGAGRGLFQGGGELPFDARRAVAHLAKADPVLGAAMWSIGPLGLVLESLHTPYESLAEAIVYQQLSGKAAATICGRVRALCGGKMPPPEKMLAIPDETLRSAGLSRAKTRAVKDLAAKTREGVIPSMRELPALPDDEIVERLTAVCGIGRWTVEMFLIFRLGRPDVLPIHDLGIQKGVAKTFGLEKLPTPKEVAARGAVWSPYRTVASWYLWRMSER